MSSSAYPPGWYPAPSEPPRSTTNPWIWVSTGLVILLAVVVTLWVWPGVLLTESSPSGEVTVPIPSYGPRDSGSETHAPVPNTAIPPRDNTHAHAVDLAPGTYTVGTDIQPGRYMISIPLMTGPPFGEFLTLNRSTSDSTASIFYSFSLHSGSYQFNPATFTVDLVSGDALIIGEFVSTLSFTPAATTMSQSLTPGYWVVGQDIPAGTYTITYEDPDPTGFGGGYLMIMTYTTSGYHWANWPIGDASSVGARFQTLTMTLTDGQVLNTTVDVLHFE